MSRSHVLLRGHALLHLLVVPVPGTYVLSKYNVLYEYTVYKVPVSYYPLLYPT